MNERANESPQQEETEMGLFGSKKKTEGASGAGAAATLEDGQSVQLDELVDCLGDSCPRPQLMTKKAVGKLGAGQVVGVKIDNPTSMEAVVAMVPELGGTLLGAPKGERGWTVVIRRD
ncbi:sulfurtransferase TusA family protein [Acidihalobacter prosperus]